MPHDKRVCRREGRTSHGYKQNYSSPKVYLKMKKKIKAQKLARRMNRRKS